jgi:hypothetical protein
MVTATARKLGRTPDADALFEPLYHPLERIETLLGVAPQDL